MDVVKLLRKCLPFWFPLEIMFNSMIHQMCEVEVNLANKHFEIAIKKSVRSRDARGGGGWGGWIAFHSKSISPLQRVSAVEKHNLKKKINKQTDTNEFI